MDLVEHFRIIAQNWWRILLVSALLAYALTITCAFVLATRSSNRRIRLLAFTIALVPLCQGV